MVPVEYMLPVASASAPIAFQSGVAARRRLPSSTAMRWINEVPVFVLVAVVWLVLAKPF